MVYSEQSLEEHMDVFILSVTIVSLIHGVQIKYLFRCLSKKKTDANMHKFVAP